MRTAVQRSGGTAEQGARRARVLEVALVDRRGQGDAARVVKRGRAGDLGVRAREGRLRGSRRGQRLLLRERVAGKMELTSGPGWSVKGGGDVSWAGRAALAQEGAGLSA